MHGKDGEVRKQKLLEALGIVEDSDRPPRPELAVAVAVPHEALNDDADALGEPLGIREVAEIIGCSAWTIRQQCLRQGLPHFRASRNGKLIFYRNQVIQWLVHKQERKEVIRSGSV